MTPILPARTSRAIEIARLATTGIVPAAQIHCASPLRPVKAAASPTVSAANAIIIRAWRMVRSLTTAVTLFVGFKHRVAGPCSFANVEIRCNEGRNGAASGIGHSISGEGGQLPECLLQGLPAQAAPSRSPPAEETRRSPREGARLQPELSRGATSALLGDRASARVDFSSATRWEH